MFRPQTTDVQRAELQDFISKGYTLSDPPEFPPGMRFDHGLAGIINLDDSPEKRRKGSLRWGGAVNSVWVSEPRDWQLRSCLVCCFADHPWLTSGSTEIPELQG